MTISLRFITVLHDRNFNSSTSLKKIINNFKSHSSYTNSIPVNSIRKIYKFIIDNFMGSVGAVGDPYVYAALSKVAVKLPNKEANYRLFENAKESVYINASVSQASEEHQERMVEFVKQYTPVTHNKICDGHFFDAFHVESEGNTLKINLRNKGVSISNASYYNTELIKDQKFSCRDFDAICNKLVISWKSGEKSYKLAALFFPNPHIENGIQLISGNYEDAVGCMVRNYRPKLMEIPTVATGKYKNLHNNLNKSRNKFQQKPNK